jgi:transposase-like protein
MSKRERRRFTVEQKLEILREANQPGVPVSDVFRRHGLTPSMFYRWRAVAQLALKREAPCTLCNDDAEARHKAEIEWLRSVLAEIMAENRELKKKLAAQACPKVN